MPQTIAITNAITNAEKIEKKIVRQEVDERNEKKETIWLARQIVREINLVACLSRQWRFSFLFFFCCSLAPVYFSGKICPGPGAARTAFVRIDRGVRAAGRWGNAEHFASLIRAPAAISNLRLSAGRFAIWWRDRGFELARSAPSRSAQSTRLYSPPPSLYFPARPSPLFRSLTFQNRPRFPVAILEFKHYTSSSLSRRGKEIFAISSIPATDF